MVKIKVHDLASCILKSKSIFGDRYDYSKTTYKKGSREKITLICKEHGEFSMGRQSHLAGRGCTLCGREETKKAVIDSRGITKEWVTSKLKDCTVTNLPKIIKIESNLDLICPTHGEFSITCKELRQRKKTPCIKCGRNLVGVNRRNSIKKVRDSLNIIHGGKYSAPNIDEEYSGSKSYLTLICESHGEFKVKYNDVKTKESGCPKCKGVECSDRLSSPCEEVIKKSKEKYGKETYGYSRLPAGKLPFKTVVEFECKTHGFFSQKIGDHLGGCKVGCPKCANNTSSGENELFKFVKEFYPDAVQGWRGLLNSNLEADVFIPELNLAIEFNGLISHSSLRKPNRDYHRNKRDIFNSQGIRLIQIWEDEWNGNNEKVKGYLKNILEKNNIRVFARKCEIRFVPLEESRLFLEVNHLLGFGGMCTQYLGLYHNSELQCLMTFKKGFVGWELNRMVNKLGVTVVGGFSKLLTYWRKNNPKEELTSYIDLDKFTGDTYELCGFVKVQTTLSLSYVYRNKRESKFNFRKDRLKEMFPDCDLKLTEKEICHSKGIYQIWNSGTVTLKLPPLRISIL